jgi:hypothetical protein
MIELLAGNVDTERPHPARELGNIFHPLPMPLKLQSIIERLRGYLSSHFYYIIEPSEKDCYIQVSFENYPTR